LLTGNEEDAQRIFVLTDEEDGRVLHLKADSVQEKLEWMQAIAKQIDTRTSATMRPCNLGGVWRYSTHPACASFPPLNKQDKMDVTASNSSEQ
jgi:hypothetical protein